MRILHIITAFDVDFPGGITNYVRATAAAQGRAGHDVYVVDDRPAHAWSRHGRHPFSVRGAEFSHYPRFALSSRVASGQRDELQQLLAELRPDIVHVHMLMGMDEELANGFASLGVPYVVSLHDYYICCPRFTLVDYAGRNCGGPERARCETCIGRLDQVDLLHRASQKFDVRLPRWRSTVVTRRNAAMRTFLDGASKVLAVSTRVAEIYQEFAPAAQIAILHIGNETASTDRPRSGPASGPLRLAFMGTLTKYKGADILFDLAESVSDSTATFHFFGRVHGKTLERRLATSGVIDHGPYVPSDLPGIAESIDAGLVVPIWEDNAPQVVMEFINLGVPVIGTRRGGIPDFVPEGTGYLFEPDTDGVRQAAQMIASLDRETLTSWAKRLPRLKSPDEHEAELEAIYAAAQEG